jgi:superfamily II DNA or RNA helicase
VKQPISIRLNNRWAFFDCTPDVMSELKKLFRYRVPGAQFSPRYKIGEWDGYRTMLSRGRVAAGLWLEYRTKLEAKYAVKLIDERTFPRFLPQHIGCKEAIAAAIDAGRQEADLTTKNWNRSRPGKYQVEKPMGMANSALDHIGRRLQEAAVVENIFENRIYQGRMVSAMVKASNTGGIVLMVTGGGKTFSVGQFLRRLDAPACFVVDEISLLDQSVAELEGALKPETVGVVGDSEFNPRRVTIATIQTLHLHRQDPKFLKWFRKLDVLIIDEVHLALNRRNLDVVQIAQPKAVFGLTATLELEKPHVRMPAVALCGPVIFEYSMAEGIRDKVLTKGAAVQVLFRDPLTGAAPGYRSKDAKGKEIFIPPNHPMADYRWRISLNGARNGCIESIVREAIKRGRKVIVLVEQLRHLNALSRRLHDIPHELMSGAVERPLRGNAKAAMDNGSVSLILATRVFQKGVNIKSLSCIIDGTASPGRNGVIQRFGRGVRVALNKDSLLYIDIADVGNRFEGAGKSRRWALEELGVGVSSMVWRGNAGEIWRGTAAQGNDKSTVADK